MSESPLAGRRVWDLPVRAVHWLLVAAVAGSWFSALLGSRYYEWHEYCGYAVLVLVTFRWIWGFAGTRYARFEEFVRGPRQVAAQIRALAARSGTPHRVGHNALGGWSIVLMLALLTAEAVTGLVAQDEAGSAGPFAALVSSAASSASSKLHDSIFDVLKALIGLHITAILFYVFVRRETLILPMLTGRKPSSVVADGAEIGGSRLPRAALIAALIVAALALAVRASRP